jgi:hypothetical protein
LTHQTQDASRPINDIEIGQEAETSISRRGDHNSGEVGGPTRRPAALKGILERRWRRKNNINSLAGLIREHSRVIAAMHNGRLSLDKGEVLSRAYGRHREMVTALEQQTLLADIQRQLAELRGEPSAQSLVDDARTNNRET